MTGFGEARDQVAGVHVTAELRSVNHRQFKLSLRCPEPWSRFEPEIERTLREQITRGAVSLALRVDREASEKSTRINPVTLSLYWRQLQTCAQQLGAPTPQDLTAVAQLPGVIDSGEGVPADPEAVGPDLLKLIRLALTSYQEFRHREGAAMQADLLAQLQSIRENVTLIAEQAPEVISEYRAKLQQRIQEAFAQAQLDSTITPSDLIREVALFTDRTDISEELVRLRSHLDQFERMISSQESAGRKLDFLCQELFREANTIGSKANHIGISHAAVDIKTAIERMREVVQNVE
ncbi:YicC family protein [bacterium]|nr:YicC family protein [bacterium]